MDLKKILDKLKDQLDTLRYQIEDIGDKIKSNKKSAILPRYESSVAFSLPLASVPSIRYVSNSS